MADTVQAGVNEAVKKSVYDPHTQPHENATAAQVALSIVWLLAILLYTLSFSGVLKLPSWLDSSSEENAKQDGGKDKSSKNKDTKLNVNKDSDINLNVENGLIENKVAERELESTKILEKYTQTSRTASPTHQPAPVKAPTTFLEVLGYVIIFGAVMFYYYLCDYKKIWAPSERIYSQDTFLFLVFMLFLVGIGYTLKPTQDKILNRDQTEEWKGWMQVMFIWYHVFAAKPWYNWIRVYIAAYVWMTGFGNFSFFWVKGDFTIWRVLKMLFRLNFLVLFVCLTVKNEYMLYYICAMHTYWFLSVYIFMRVLNSWNTNRIGMAIKFTVYAICNALIFDVPGVAEVVFRPLGFILGFHEDRFGLMHEWAFRAGLDHWACFIGMLCAYNYPNYEALIQKLESESTVSSVRLFGKSVIGILMVVTLTIWYNTVMQLDKFQYNAFHPYTSWIPIVSYIVLRNLFPTLRKYYVHLFSFLGKITLETYLSQLHIYLQSNAKEFITYIPDSPLLNFSLATIIYLSLSYALFHLTVEFSGYLLPKNLRQAALRFGYVAVVFGLATGLAVVLKYGLA